MYICASLRTYLRIAKKMTLKDMKFMRNGAVWLCYIIEGVKCSTFAALTRIEKLIKAVSFSAVESTALNLVVLMANSLNLLNQYDVEKGFVKIVVRKWYNDKSKDRNFYVVIESDKFRVYESARLTSCILFGSDIKVLLEAIKSYDDYGVMTRP
jgi:hypothetical protein